MCARSPFESDRCAIVDRRLWGRRQLVRSLSRAKLPGTHPRSGAASHRCVLRARLWPIQGAGFQGMNPHSGWLASFGAAARLANAVRGRLPPTRLRLLAGRPRGKAPAVVGGERWITGRPVPPQSRRRPLRFARSASQLRRHYRVEGRLPIPTPPQSSLVRHHRPRLTAIYSPLLRSILALDPSLANADSHHQLRWLTMQVGTFLSPSVPLEAELRLDPRGNEAPKQVGLYASRGPNADSLPVVFRGLWHLSRAGRSN